MNSLGLDSSGRRVFELGCGNGSVVYELSKLGYDVTGVDPSEQSITQANQCYPELKLHKGSAYDEVPGQYGQFPVVIGLDVVEHVYFPKKFASTLFGLVAEGGIAIVPTPYHGYWKNIALALTGKMDDHFTACGTMGTSSFGP